MWSLAHVWLVVLRKRIRGVILVFQIQFWLRPNFSNFPQGQVVAQLLVPWFFCFSFWPKEKNFRAIFRSIFIGEINCINLVNLPSEEVTQIQWNRIIEMRFALPQNSFSLSWHLFSFVRKSYLEIMCCMIWRSKPLNSIHPLLTRNQIAATLILWWQRWIIFLFCFVLFLFSFFFLSYYFKWSSLNWRVVLLKD